jgi:hypothetical protein
MISDSDIAKDQFMPLIEALQQEFDSAIKSNAPDETILRLSLRLYWLRAQRTAFLSLKETE